MTIDVGVLETLLISIVVLFIGAFANSKVGFLRNYNIPEPVVGGYCLCVDYHRAVLLYIN